MVDTQATVETTTPSMGSFQNLQDNPKTETEVVLNIQNGINFCWKEHENNNG